MQTEDKLCGCRALRAEYDMIVYTLKKKKSLWLLQFCAGVDEIIAMNTTSIAVDAVIGWMK